MPQEISLPRQYQSKQDPNRYNGSVLVTGSRSVDLGLGHNNFDVFIPEKSTIAPHDVAISKSAAALGKFTITINEVPARLIEGGLVKAPTNASTQATGAGITVWRVDIDAVVAKVGGVVYEAAAQADYVIHDTTQYTGLDSGDSAIATVVLKNDDGTVSFDVVKGSAAVTGSQVAPTDAEIQADLGAGVSWLRVCDCTINRTGDTTVTQSQNNKVRFTPQESGTEMSVDFLAFVKSSVG